MTTITNGTSSSMISKCSYLIDYIARKVEYVGLTTVDLKSYASPRTRLELALLVANTQMKSYPKI